MPSAPDLPAERPRFLVATFHYVGMPETPFAGIHGLSGDQFRAAVTKLAEAWNVVSLADLRGYLSADASLPDRCCLITFDDGLRCQFEVALPILEDLGLPAVFFVMGAPYATDAAAIVHKLHYIRAYAGDAAVTEAIQQNAGPAGGTDIEAIDEAEARRHYRYDGMATAKLKYFLNYLADEDLVVDIARRMLDGMGISERAFIEKFYMDRPMIRHLGSTGSLGSHAFSHRPLAGMTPGAIRSELLESKRLLEQISGVSVDSISYPFGSPNAVDRQVADLTREAGYGLGFTTERAVNRSLSDPLLLARLDALDLDRWDDFDSRQRYLQEA